jgi:hypothetical protein
MSDTVLDNFNIKTQNFKYEARISFA